MPLTGASSRSFDPPFEIEGRIDIGERACDRAAAGVDLVLTRGNEKRRKPNQDQDGGQNRDGRGKSPLALRLGRSLVRLAVPIRRRLNRFAQRLYPPAPAARHIVVAVGAGVLDRTLATLRNYCNARIRAKRPRQAG